MAKMTLNELVQQLTSAHGEALEAVVLYGSAARHPEGFAGPMDVLVVVRTLTDSALRAAGATSRSWMEAGNPAPLTLTSAEWASGADIFAMEYADILASHRVVQGTLRTEGLVVRKHDLRLQLEREVTSKVLQLRRELQARLGNAAAERALLEGAYGTIFAIFRSTLRLTDGVTAAHADSAAVATQVASQAGFDAAPFLALVGHRHGTSKIKDTEAHRVLFACHEALQRLAAYLDALDLSE